MYQSYLMLADKKLKRKRAALWNNKEEAVNNLYPEGVAMAMVFSEEVYLCVTDADTLKSAAIYEISKNGDINKIAFAS